MLKQFTTRLFLTCAFFMTAFSTLAQAYTVSDIQGQWKSVSIHTANGGSVPGADKMEMMLKFAGPDQFSMTQRLGASNGQSYKRLFQGTFEFKSSDILLALATSETVTLESTGKTATTPLSPAYPLMLTIKSANSGLMTIQFAGQDMYIDFEKTP